MARIKFYNKNTNKWEYADTAFDSSSSGEDGFSPSANVTQTNDGAVITIVDKLGTTTATIKHGDNYELTEDDKQEIAELTAPLVEVQGGGSTSIELDTTLKVSGKAADAKSVGDELDKKLSKSGGTMTGKIIFPTGDQNVGFANSEDMKIFGYGPVDETVHMRMGDTQYPFQIRGAGDRPKYNDSEIALMGDIPTDEHINELINTASDVFVGPDKPIEKSVLLWVNTNAPEEPGEDSDEGSGSPGGYYTPMVV